MRWIYFPFYCSLIMIIPSCAHQRAMPGEETNQDTVRYVIMKYDNPEMGKLQAGYSPGDLSIEEIKKVEELLHKSVHEYNQWIKEPFGTIRELSQYRRQFFVVINPKGEKEVRVNCFCGKDHPEWKTRPVLVMDGGSCYFYVSINLTIQIASQPVVNGVG